MRRIDNADFKIESIGKGMPYAAPSAEFFDEFTAIMLHRVEQAQRARLILRRSIAGVLSAVAAIVVALVISMPKATSADSFASFDVALDAYVNNLSDDEISTILYSMEIDDTFYSTL